MTKLDADLKSLIVDFDDSTMEAGFILKELSRNAFGARPMDQAKVSEALSKVCAEAEIIALDIVDAITKITANQ